MVYNARRVPFEIDHADRIYVAVRAPAVPGIGGQRQFPIGCHRYVVGEDARWQVALVVGDLLAVDRQQRDLVGGGFDRERALAVRGDGDRGDLVGARSDRHRFNDQDVLAPDREHRDRAIGTIGDERQITLWTDRHTGRLLTDRDRADHLGRGRLQVDQEDLVVGVQPVRPALGCRLQGIRDESNIARRTDGQVGRGPGDGIYQ